MMNQDNPYAMNQTCKVCGEPAAGFHFGAFTCEGCKSFFGRSYNNLSSISDCKNNGECIINKKNRTACKACRLRKCLMVGMSKSGSRYGRRSNWFKIHCLLQEQQQQAAAAMAAHHNSQQQAAAAHAHGQHPLAGQKPPAGVVGVPPPAAAAAALGMLGHPGAYPGLYPPRTKEELIMLGLEEYAKHPAASPSVSSPDSHNSDSSVEVNVRGNPLLHLTGKHSESAAMGVGAATGTPPQLRKDLPHFLPLPFSGLASMPVMPPPAFLPPSHLLFSGYHPALYQHHQGLLKPSPEQQQAVAAAAVQHLFNSSNAAAAAAAVPNRFAPAVTATTTPNSLPLATKPPLDREDRTAPSPKNDVLNNNHIPNGSKVADEFTKRFYLDAVLKSQRSSSPLTATKLPTHTKHDHSISALVTPNSESGRERLKSRQSNEEDGPIEDEDPEIAEVRLHDNNSNCDEEEEDLVVSMTPPRSPANSGTHIDVTTAPANADPSQDNPIDLSMKASSSVASSLSSKCSSVGSVQAVDSENEQEAETTTPTMQNTEKPTESNGEMDPANIKPYVEIYADSKATNNNNNNNNSSNNNNNIERSKDYENDHDDRDKYSESVKRKTETDSLTSTPAEGTQTASATATVKRLKLELVEPLEKTTTTASALKTVTTTTTTTPLDLTTKV